MLYGRDKIVKTDGQWCLERCGSKEQQDNEFKKWLSENPLEIVYEKNMEDK